MIGAGLEMDTAPTRVHYPYDGSLRLSGSILTIGTFDGVHKGHQQLLHRVVRKARAMGVSAIAYTFDPPPKSVFGSAMQITCAHEKARRLSYFGLDHVLVARFDKDYAARPAQAFIEEIGRLNPMEVWVGEDFCFGKGRQGNVDTLKKYFQVRILDEVKCVGGQRISSTRLRDLLAKSRISEAHKLHGWPAE